MSLLFVFLHLSSVLCFNHYTNHWAVKLDGGINEAKRVASEHGFVLVSEIMPGYYNFKHHSLKKRSVESSPEYHADLISNPKVEWAEQQVAKIRVKRDFTYDLFKDPLWPQTWYMSDPGDNTMRVVEVYNRYNITGAGIHVTILDDGLEKDHPDLKDNYDPGSSYDVNDQDDDPEPKYDDFDENRHGTRCAGEVAAAADNNICSVGIAYKAGIGGVRMLDGDVTDAVEAQSLSLNPQHIDIFSISWGPEDNGMTVDGPGPLARQAFFDGIYKGRNKLGSIFVWASGNGGLKGDSCACDGYTNSIYTLSISSASENGNVPWYSEPCASTLAATYSSGSISERQIVTTDIRKRCTSSHTGTSASAPLAAGICALVLEANKQLTWRDMQYIVFLTARKGNLDANDWVVNGVGRLVSHHFGYGLMDATAMVEAALNWVPLPDHHRCVAETSRGNNNRLIPSDSSAFSSITTNGCRGTIDAVLYLEHVECIVTLHAARRGEVEVFLTSPIGTKSQLLIKRSADRSNQGFVGWTFMTTHSWGEDPFGEWKLEIKNYATSSNLVEWTLGFYGVATKPAVYGSFLGMHWTSSIPPPSSSNDSIHKISNASQSLNEDNFDFNKTSIKEDEIMKMCASSEFFFNQTCLPYCPSGYYGSKRFCKPCMEGCSRCTRGDDCIQIVMNNSKWYVAIGAVCSLMTFIVITGVFLSICFWRRKNFQYKNVIILNLNRNASNNRLLHRTTFHSNSTNGNSLLPIDTIKKPLLMSNDPLSSEDETNRSNAEP